jgi:3-oxoacyl-[acyl-carrier-protein] synthase II
MNVAGLGVVFAGGRGIGALTEALRRGWTPPQRREIAFSPGRTLPVYAVDDETIKDKAVLKGMRRADRFSKMAVLAAWDAVRDAGIETPCEGEGLGIILATAFGPQVTAFQFLDEIIDYGDASVSPILFSHSVHNAAASYVASALGNRGPTLTLTQFGSSFHQALVLAEAWLREGRCAKVLVGSVEECGAVMEHLCSRKLELAEDGRIRPFDCSASPLAVPGEGSAFLLLSGGAGPKRYCELRGVLFDPESAEERPDLRILDADGMSGDETRYRRYAGQDAMIAAYSPLFGSMMTGSAFHCASAALMLWNQTRYACPVRENPHGMRLCSATEQARLERIQCVKCGCSGREMVIDFAR